MQFFLDIVVKSLIHISARNHLILKNIQVSNAFFIWFLCFPLLEEIQGHNCHCSTFRILKQ